MVLESYTVGPVHVESGPHPLGPHPPQTRTPFHVLLGMDLPGSDSFGENQGLGFHRPDFSCTGERDPVVLRGDQTPSPGHGGRRVRHASGVESVKGVREPEERSHVSPRRSFKVPCVVGVEVVPVTPPVVGSSPEDMSPVPQPEKSLLGSP